MSLSYLLVNNPHYSVSLPNHPTTPLPLPYCPTTPLYPTARLPRFASLSHCSTVSLLHRFTAPLSHCPALPHYLTSPLPYCPTTALHPVHSNPTAPLPRSISMPAGPLDRSTKLYHTPLLRFTSPHTAALYPHFASLPHYPLTHSHTPLYLYLTTIIIEWSYGHENKTQQAKVVILNAPEEVSHRRLAFMVARRIGLLVEYFEIEKLGRLFSPSFSLSSACL